MDTKRIVSWALALVLAVLVSSQVLHAAGGQPSHGQAGRIATPQPPLAPPRWQYLTVVFPPVLSVSFDEYTNTKALNALGLQGWELVAAFPARSDGDNDVSKSDSSITKTFAVHKGVLIFKKPL
jgi:hypothetical protein